MRFWRSLTSGRARNHLLIDIGAHSAAGAYAAYGPDGSGTVVWTARVPITVRDREEPKAALARALDELCGVLIQGGAPALARAAGSSRIGHIRIALDTPWQVTEVHAEEVREAEPFTFTRRIMTEMLDAALAAGPADDSAEVEQHVIAVRLNGYQTRDPLGKKAKRVSLTIVTSRLRKDAIETANAAVKHHFHLSHARYSSGPALRYRVLRGVFPHERDMLIIDAVGSAGTISLVRAGSLVAVEDFATKMSNEVWEKAAEETLRKLATMYPLPRTILLVTAEGEAASRLDLLKEARLSALWLSDIPPNVISVSGAAIDGLAFGPDALPDTRLALLARYEQREFAEE